MSRTAAWWYEAQPLILRVLARGGEQHGVDEQDDTVSEPGESQRRIPVELHSVYESGPFTRCTICNGRLHSQHTTGGFESVDSAEEKSSLVSGTGHDEQTPHSVDDDCLHDGPDDLHDGPDDLHDGPDDGQAVYEIQKVFRGPEVLFEMAICRRCGEQVAKEFSEESIAAMKGFLLSNFKPDEDASHCHFCAFPLALLEGWTMVGACKENQLIFPAIILCEPCSENLQQRLSKTTRDVQDEFIRDHFPGVPADLDFSPSVFGV